MTLIVDATAVVALLIDVGPDGDWARNTLAEEHLAAPHLMPVEVASTLRRAAAAGIVTQDAASMAHADLLDLEVDLFEYAPLGARAWELRSNVTAYAAFYVALAETLDARLVTLDRRLASSPGPRCEFLVP